MTGVVNFLGILNKNNFAKIRQHLKIASRSVCVRNGARFKNKLMGVMVYFKPAKINTNQYYESDSLNAGNNSTILNS